MRFPSAELTDAEIGRLGRALRARGTIWLVATIFVTAALAAWVITRSADAVLSHVPLDRREAVASELQTHAVVAWGTSMLLAVVASVVALWMVGGWSMVGDRVMADFRSLMPDDSPRDPYRLESRGDSQLEMSTGGSPDDVEETSRLLTSRAAAVAREVAEVQQAVVAIADEAASVRQADSAAARGAAAGELDAAIAREDLSRGALRVSIDLLGERAEAASSAALERAAHDDAVSEAIRREVTSVDDAITAVQSLASTVRGVGGRVEDMSSDATAAAATVREMEASSGRAVEEVEEVTRLAGKVAADAEQGVVVVREAQGGLDRIRVFTDQTGEAFARLGQRIGGITRILSVINEIADETNLLALNAAIIAAQAGENGKAFAVVADEIKDLAERVGASTKEIADLVRAVSVESTHALRTIEQGVSTMEDGFRLSRRSEDALGVIRDGATKTLEKARGLSRGGGIDEKHVAALSAVVARVSENVRELARAAGEEIKEVERAIRATGEARTFASSMEHAVGEQAQGSKSVIRAIDAIAEGVRQLGAQNAEQVRLGLQTAKAFANCKTEFADGERVAAVLSRLLGAVIDLSDNMRSRRGTAALVAPPADEPRAVSNGR